MTYPTWRQMLIVIAVSIALIITQLSWFEPQDEQGYEVGKMFIQYR